MSDLIEQPLYQWREKEKEEDILHPNVLEDDVVEEDKHMSLPQFMNRGRMLENGEYDYKDGKVMKKGKKKTKKKGRMRDVVTTLTKLDDLLMQQVDLVGDLETCRIIQNAFLDACKACDDYINNMNPWTAEGKARKKIVTDLYQQVSLESTRFSSMAGNPDYQDVLQRCHTGAELLGEVRVTKYEDGQDGVKIHKGGKGTSEIFIIEKDGKKQFFKQAEKLESDWTVLWQKERDDLDQKYNAMKEINPERSAQYKQTYKNRKIMLFTIKKCIIERFGSFNSINIKRLCRKKKAEELMLELLEENAGSTIDRTPIQTAMEQYNELQNQLSQAKMQLRDDEPNEEIQNHIKQIEKEIEDSDYRYILDTTWNIRKALMLDSVSRNSAMIEAGENVSKRNVATSRMADILGLKELVPKTQMADLEIDGKKMRGIVMDEAKGESFDMVINRRKNAGGNIKVNYTENAYRQTLSMQILDLICGQVDRNTSNYMATTETDQNGNISVTGITLIDNDISFGELPYEAIQSRGKLGYNMIRNIEVDGKMIIPGIDKQLALKILSIPADSLNYLMVDILSVQERKCLVDRFVKVQAVIRKRMDLETKWKKKKKKFVSKFPGNSHMWKENMEQYKNEYINADKRGKFDITRSNYVVPFYL